MCGAINAECEARGDVDAMACEFTAEVGGDFSPDTGRVASADDGHGGAINQAEITGGEQDRWGRWIVFETGGVSVTVGDEDVAIFCSIRSEQRLGLQLPGFAHELAATVV